MIQIHQDKTRKLDHHCRPKLILSILFNTILLSLLLPPQLSHSSARSPEVDLKHRRHSVQRSKKGSHSHAHCCAESFGKRWGSSRSLPWQVEGHPTPSGDTRRHALRVFKRHHTAAPNHQPTSIQARGLVAGTLEVLLNLVAQRQCAVTSVLTTVPFACQVNIYNKVTKEKCLSSCLLCK